LEDHVKGEPSGLYFTIDRSFLEHVSPFELRLLKAQDGKFFINKDNEGLKVYDESGSLLYSWDYGNGYHIDGRLCRTNKTESIFGVRNGMSKDTSDKKGLRVSFDLKNQSQLNEADLISQINEDSWRNLSVEKDLLNEYDKDVKKSFFIFPEQPKSDLLSNGGDYYCNDAVLKIYTDFDRRFPVSDLRLTDLSSEKIIRVSGYFIDNQMNVLVYGFKSDQYKVVMPFEDSEGLKGTRILKVLNPVFFIWRFENK